MAYTIEAAITSGIFEEIMVSTDSVEYAEIAKSYGASVPFLRSEVNAEDSANSWNVVKEVLDHYCELGKDYDDFCLLQPTSPLRTACDIQGAYRYYKDKNATSVVSVCECEHSPRWCNTLNEKMELDGFIEEKHNIQRQKLEKYYRINGAIYIRNIKAFRDNLSIYGKGSYAYIMSRENSVDIDTMMDFKITEILLAEKWER